MFFFVVLPSPVLTGCTAPVDLAPVLELATPDAHTLSVGLDSWVGESVTVTCMGEADQHTRTLTAEPGIPLIFSGTLSDVMYTCGCDAGGRITSAEIRTPADAHPLPPFTLTGAAADLGNGYVLFNVFVNGLEADEQQVVIIDGEGRIRWSEWIGDDARGDLDTSLLADGTILYGGGYEVPPTNVTLDGEVVWVAPDAPTGGSYHHQAALAADGSIIGMATSEDPNGDATYTGHWIGAWSREGDLAWAWQTTSAVEQGIFNPGSESSDPFHVNAAVEVDWPGCDLLVSARNADSLLCVDRASGLVTFTLEDDFTLLDDAGEAMADDWTDGQHDPQPDGDRLLVFDNGPSRRGDVQTRVVEYELDLEARTARLLWTYNEAGWNVEVWGGARRFGDDHVLVAFPHCLECSEDDDPARSSIIALDGEHSPVWRLAFEEATVGIYRATWIDPCTIFDNASYCVP